jgi:hypothetical protein
MREEHGQAVKSRVVCALVEGELEGEQDAVRDIAWNKYTVAVKSTCCTPSPVS